MFHTSINTIFDELLLTSDGTHLTGCYFSTEALKKNLLKTHQQQNNLAIFLDTQKQLEEYSQKQRNFFDLPLKFTQGTPFQQKIWDALKTIRYGQTISYQDLANSINAQKSARPVGGAVGKNPISIIVPCHRVIGRNGSLTGFGGGLERKKLLLRLET